MSEDPNKALAKEYLKQLLQLSKTGKFPIDVYQLIMKFSGKGTMKEQPAKQYFQNVCENMVKQYKNTSDPPKKEVEKVMRGFEARMKFHNVHQMKWANYYNDPLCMYMLDHPKVWDQYTHDELK